ncbi:MAG: CPBP family intramembrane glutamic endopeptidase [Pseudomonadota bacterium]
MPRLRADRFLLALIEVFVVFIGLPLLALSYDAVVTLPVVMGAMLTSTIVLLSATRQFHWADLLPVDFWSERRLAASFLLAFVFTAGSLSLFYWPERIGDVSADTVIMLLAFPLVTALPMELVYRALFFRRYGHLIASEPLAIFLGALATALGYAVLSGSPAGVAFGFGVGLALGWTYLNTGNFVLCVLIHWFAAVSIFLVGPGVL